MEALMAGVAVEGLRAHQVETMASMNFSGITREAQ